MITFHPHAPRLRPVIRVFVSSTFSDMKHERNALAAEVYPEMEELCRKNGFQFQAIDLRWGVSTEAGLDHRTMRIVLAALELFMRQGGPRLDLGRCQKPLAVGSGNAAATGRILLEQANAVFADESTYESKLASIRGFDGAILISASGKKHAVSIASDLEARGYDRRLLTCNPDAFCVLRLDAKRLTG
jgi:hypothetical protein